MMTNRKRRAIHDFIAGTIVIVKSPSNATSPLDATGSVA